jgi:hypothetical protein
VHREGHHPLRSLLLPSTHEPPLPPFPCPTLLSLQQDAQGRQEDA